MNKQVFPSANQGAKPNCDLSSSRFPALGGRYVLVSNSYWFTALLIFFLIGQIRLFGMDFVAVVSSSG